MPRPKLLSDDAVLKSAMRVMARAGPADFTLAEVAREAGIAAATLVQRFGGKQHLIVRALKQDNLRLEQILDQLPEGQSAAAVIALFRILTPEVGDAATQADQFHWLGLDMRDPELNALAQDRFALLRAAVARRLPPLGLAPDDAARLVEAQWQGALAQWAVDRQGALADYVTRSLASWFALAAR
ncbi:MAG: TetR/AcrR family transcriptional regulator [Caulobacterales bacterium]